MLYRQHGSKLNSWNLIICFLIIMLLTTLILYIILDQKYRAFEIDHLTDLYSKGYSEQQLAKIMVQARKNKKPFCVTMIDIDDFKQINDSLGHLTGDFILSAVGKLLKKNLRHIDICSRYGGDEFIVILPETPMGRFHAYPTETPFNMKAANLLWKIHSNISPGYNDIQEAILWMKD